MWVRLNNDFDFAPAHLLVHPTWISWWSPGQQRVSLATVLELCHSLLFPGTDEFHHAPHGGGESWACKSKFKMYAEGEAGTAPCAPWTHGEDEAISTHNTSCTCWDVLLMTRGL